MLVLEIGLFLVEIILASGDGVLPLIEVELTLLQLVFRLEELLVALLNLFFKFVFLIEKYFFDFEQFLFLDAGSILVCFGNDLVVFALENKSEYNKAYDCAYDEATNNIDNCHNVEIVDIVLFVFWV